MTIEILRAYCLSLKGVEEKMPFDDKTLVFTVKDKMFCLTDIKIFAFVNLKCKPKMALELRAQYSEVTPGYYMNKKHWNSVKPQGHITDALLKEWILNSYNLVVAGLPKKVQKELQNDL